jgi:hypothetical protein
VILIYHLHYDGIRRVAVMNKGLSFDDIDADDFSDDIMPDSRIAKIIDEIEFTKDDYEDIEITLSSLGLE